MKSIKSMSLKELAAFVASHLEHHEIPVVLVGGSCVSIYTKNRYQTADLDFVERYHTQRKKLKVALALIGFTEKNRYFVHPDAVYFLEFPAGPLSVGDEPVSETNQLKTKTGVLTLLTPTDSIKDRLAAYYHWNDRQSLQQAIWIAQSHAVDIKSIRAWSQREGMAEKFQEFETARVKKIKGTP